MDAENSKQTGKKVAGQMMTRAVASSHPASMKISIILFFRLTISLFLFFLLPSSMYSSSISTKAAQQLSLWTSSLLLKACGSFSGSMRVSEDTPDETLRILGFSAKCKNVDDVRDLLHLDISF